MITKTIFIISLLIAILLWEILLKPTWNWLIIKLTTTSNKSSKYINVKFYFPVEINIDSTTPFDISSALEDIRNSLDSNDILKNKPVIIKKYEDRFVSNHPDEEIDLREIAYYQCLEDLIDENCKINADCDELVDRLLSVSSKTTIDMVKDFMEIGNQFIPEDYNHSSINNVELTDFRIRLLQEELNELRAALTEKDAKEVLDALLDLRYVLDGAVISFGFEKVFYEAFNQVHESNMSKFCNSMDEATETIANYELQGLETYAEATKLNNQTLWIVRRKFDGKILKSINYKPVNLYPYIHEQQTAISNS